MVLDLRTAAVLIHSSLLAPEQADQDWESCLVCVLHAAACACTSLCWAVACYRSTSYLVVEGFVLLDVSHVFVCFGPRCRGPVLWYSSSSSHVCVR